MFFKRKRKPQSQAGTRAMSVEPSYIGRNSTLEGHIVCEGELHIDGSVRGRVRAQMCVVDRYGVVHGDISGDIVHVRGRVIGPIQGSAVYVYSGAHIEGDVYNDTLSIEPGAYVDGALRHNPQPVQAQSARMAQRPATEASALSDETAKTESQKLRVISSRE
jgi:cytoskeletal protein CcmA (bactofilin family)